MLITNQFHISHQMLTINICCRRTETYIMSEFLCLVSHGNFLSFLKNSNLVKQFLLVFHNNLAIYTGFIYLFKINRIFYKPISSSKFMIQREVVKCVKAIDKLNSNATK